MSDEMKSVETILPFGNTLKPLVASSNALTISDLKNSLAQKGIFTSSYSKEDILPLTLTSLLSPIEFENLQSRQRNKEAIPKRQSRTYTYTSENDLLKMVSKLNEIKINDLKRWDLESYEVTDVNNFTIYERNSNKLHMTYTIKRTDYVKDWFNQTSSHDASIEVSVDKDEKKLMISNEHSADETKELNALLVKEITSILKREEVIENEKGNGIKFGDFSNESRINFLLNFVNDNLDKSDTFEFDEITNIEISIDSEKTLPEDFQWMEDKVSNMKFEGNSLHETDILKDNTYHPSLIISLLKINYKFRTKSSSGDCVVEIEFPTTRGKSIPDTKSEFMFKFINIKCKNKINSKDTRKMLYRVFDNFKEECYKKTLAYMNEK